MAKTEKKQQPAVINRVKNVLVPIDFSPASKDAFRQALRLVGDAPGSRITLLHVIASSPSKDGSLDVSRSIDGARKSLVAFSKNGRLSRDGSVRTVVRTGTPFHEILTTAKENDVEMIVLAVHDSAPFGGLALGHTVDRVSRYAPCPVLLVRQGESSESEVKRTAIVAFPSAR